SIHDAIVRVLGFDMVLNLALGLALGKLGKVPEGCVTLFEVGARYPDTPAQAEAEIALQSMGCL
ncbi:MAG: hypothetical protein ACPGFC_05040, partial [Paracoccaceae bacterium]